MHGLLGPAKLTGPLTQVLPAETTRFCSTLCIYAMRYEWDEAKNLRNQRRHDGISFELAALVFEDERCLVYADRTDSRT